MAENKTFQKLKMDLSKKVTEINMKTSSFLEITKIRTYNHTLEKEIQELNLQAGEKGYQNWIQKLDQPELEDLEGIYRKIQAREKRIQEQLQAIEQLELQESQVLGHKPKEQEVCFCPNCGAKYTGKVNYCTKCGSKI